MDFKDVRTDIETLGRYFRIVMTHEPTGCREVVEGCGVSEYNARRECKENLEARVLNYPGDKMLIEKPAIFTGSEWNDFEYIELDRSFGAYICESNERRLNSEKIYIPMEIYEIPLSEASSEKAKYTDIMAQFQELNDFLHFLRMEAISEGAQEIPLGEQKYIIQNRKSPFIRTDFDGTKFIVWRGRISCIPSGYRAITEREYLD